MCVCDATQCETLDPVPTVPRGDFVKYTSSKVGLRFKSSIGKFEPVQQASVTIDRSVRKQSITGFGGAFTDSTGINVNSLPEPTRTTLLRSYFAEDGIEYNIGRVPIGGTDFSTFGYSYLDSQEEGANYANEKNYTLVMEDLEYKISLIKQARELTSSRLDLFASAWTAPKAWKTNGEYAGYGLLIEDYYQAWADYFIRFLDLYKDEDVEFWALTTGNEPMTGLIAITLIPSVGWYAPEKSVWIRENLGPALKNSQHTNTLLLGFDDQRIIVNKFEEVIANDETRSYIDGMAIHWYWDRLAPPSVLDNFHEKFPDIFIFGTEACRGELPLEQDVILGSWDRGEHYATDIMEDLQHWVTGWTDWNMALDLEGGPTYIKNNVDSPIIVNATAGEFYKQPMYYAMGHFSKFLQRGSIRIGLDDKYDGVTLVAFERPDGSTAIVVINTQDKDIPIEIADASRGSITTVIDAKSFNSILYW